MNPQTLSLKPTLLLFLSCLAPFGPQQSASAREARTSLQAERQTQDAIHQLWTANVDPILGRPVSSSQSAYYAGEMLMVPLHAAFRLNDSEWEKAFSDHFQRLMQSHSQLPDVTLSR